MICEEASCQRGIIVRQMHFLSQIMVSHMGGRGEMTNVGDKPERQAKKIGFLRIQGNTFTPIWGHLTFQTLVKLDAIFLNYRFDLNHYLQMV